MKRVAMLIGAGALALAQPAMAQDAAQDMSGLAAAMSEMFKAEPLTPEQQARVPQVERGQRPLRLGGNRVTTYDVLHRTWITAYDA